MSPLVFTVKSPVLVTSPVSAAAVVAVAAFPVISELILAGSLASFTVPLSRLEAFKDEPSILLLICV